MFVVEFTNRNNNRGVKLFFSSWFFFRFYWILFYFLYSVEQHSHATAINKHLWWAYVVCSFTIIILCYCCCYCPIIIYAWWMNGPELKKIFLLIIKTKSNVHLSIWWNEKCSGAVYVFLCCYFSFIYFLRCHTETAHLLHFVVENLHFNDLSNSARISLKPPEYIHHLHAILWNWIDSCSTSIWD